MIILGLILFNVVSFFVLVWIFKKRDREGFGGIYSFLAFGIIWIVLTLVTWLVYAILT
jgi:hypothetical protein